MEVPLRRQIHFKRFKSYWNVPLVRLNFEGKRVGLGNYKDKIKEIVYKGKGTTSISRLSKLLSETKSGIKDNGNSKPRAHSIPLFSLSLNVSKIVEISVQIRSGTSSITSSYYNFQKVKKQKNSFSFSLSQSNVTFYMFGRTLLFVLSKSESVGHFSEGPTTRISNNFGAPKTIYIGRLFRRGRTLILLPLFKRYLKKEGKSR